MSTSILQEWVTKLPLRHQGVLLAAVRGFDGWPKHSEPKALVREMRALFLVPADARELVFGKGFMSPFDIEKSEPGFAALCREMDALNLHYFAHLLHAIEVIAGHHPQPDVRFVYWRRYRALVNKLHLNPESREEMTARLTEDRVAKGTVES